MVLHLLADLALACGGFFGGSGDVIFSDAQVVRFEPVAEGVAVEYGVRYEGDPAAFGWIVPIPGDFVSVEEGDPDALFDLVRETNPDVGYHAEEGGGGCLAGGTDKAGGGMRNGGEDLGVETGTAGVFDYAVITTDDAQQLLDWLDENGWSVAASAPDLEAYVAEGWRFVALELNSELPMGYASARIVYGGDVMAYPARMSRSSMADQQRTTILVVGDQKATMSGWSADEVDGLASVGDTGAASLYEGALADLGGDRKGYGVPFYGEVDGVGYVTRFDTIADSAVHDADVVVALDGGTPESHRAAFDLYESEKAQRQAEGGGCSTAGGFGAALPILLAAALLTRRSRRG